MFIVELLIPTLVFYTKMYYTKLLVFILNYNFVTMLLNLKFMLGSYNQQHVFYCLNNYEKQTKLQVF